MDKCIVREENKSRIKERDIEIPLYNWKDFNLINGKGYDIHIYIYDHK